MKIKYWLLVLFAFVLVSCSSEDDPLQTIKIEITNTSDHPEFFEGVLLLKVSLADGNGAGYSSVAGYEEIESRDREYVLLSKSFNPEEEIRSLMLEQRYLDLEITTILRLKDEYINDTQMGKDGAVLSTKIILLTEGKVFKTIDLTFDANRANSMTSVVGYKE